MSISMKSVSLSGITCEDVVVEVQLSKGMPYFNIVGLCSKEIRESRERIKTAIENSGLKFPMGRITVNLAPANLKKKGTYYDLPIALAILSSAYNIDTTDFSEFVFFGELSLSGKIRSIPSAFTIVKQSVLKKHSKIVFSHEDLSKCRNIEGSELYSFRTLRECFNFIRYKDMKPIKGKAFIVQADEIKENFSDIHGCFNAKRALEVAASGKHNVLILGPPGSGKTFLADAFSSILPELTYEESLEVSCIYDSVGMLTDGEPIHSRPVRRPHPSITKTGLIGGGHDLSPGEVTLSHRGVLILHELLEFDRPKLDMLRQPVEDKFIQLSKNLKSKKAPCDFIMIATSNLCPCGNYSSSKESCSCSSTEVKRYHSKLSGALLDRFDIILYLDNTLPEDYDHKEAPSDSKDILKRVSNTWSCQKKRNNSGAFNSTLSLTELRNSDNITEDSLTAFMDISSHLQLSNRGLLKVLRLARTIADMENASSISLTHIYEAINYRQNIFSKVTAV